MQLSHMGFEPATLTLSVPCTNQLSCPAGNDACNKNIYISPNASRKLIRTMYESSLRHRHEILATCSVAITFSFYVLCGGDEGLLPVDIPLRVERLIDPAEPSVS
ncbi:Hypothetical predicted protein [Podarcis lilfordi]|uniref:Uncharacterized protein n=1 Tax=Podarcis lilfordi TaxID=74358 RepID=A0AA35JNG5_9SAUR|nr:Hypothetical predicted protein [Podarcis lilfordi]